MTHEGNQGVCTNYFAYTEQEEMRFMAGDPTKKNKITNIRAIPYRQSHDVAQQTHCWLTIAQ